jgi:predicted XRE-type DNA-binding protein
MVKSLAYFTEGNAKGQPMSELFRQVRQLIESAEESRYSISKATGVSESSLSQFMAETKGLSHEAIEKVLAHLGYEIKVQKRRK